MTLYVSADFHSHSHDSPVCLTLSPPWQVHSVTVSPLLLATPDQHTWLNCVCVWFCTLVPLSTMALSSRLKLWEQKEGVGLSGNCMKAMPGA